MRRTNEDRWQARLSSISGNAIPGLFWRRCEKCKDDVRKESMWTWKYHWHSGVRSFPATYYYCQSCAPTQAAMLEILLTHRRLGHEHFIAEHEEVKRRCKNKETT
jgi:hypothetical protein